jgi:membrane associated rhomboid family serine protease
MIPIRDTTPSRNYPVVNTAIIGINVLIFLWQLSQGPELNRLIYYYGLVPARYTVPRLAEYFTTGQQLFSLLSFMFLHGGFLHLLGNMWSLYIFGDNVEDRLGPLRYLAFYLFCGIASGLSHLILNLYSNVPTIGASGAIAGVMGAYFILQPQSKILTLVPIFIIPLFVEIPAFFFIGIWFVLQFLNAAGSPATAAGIAWWAHVGGFVFGIAFVKLFQKLPDKGLTRLIRPVTARKKSHSLQVVRPEGAQNEAHIYGTIRITPYEALAGTHKLVNITRGFQKHPFRVSVPPGVKDGTLLRLKGLGRRLGQDPAGPRGDLFLRVEIRQLA